MPSTVTTTGEQFFITVATGQTPLANGKLADKILFAKIDGLDVTSTPPASETIPAELVDTVDISQWSATNADTMIFTAVLESSFGDYEFNWLGLYNSEHDVLIQVAYEPTQTKIATSGQNIGTVLAKTMALQIKGGAAIFNMQESAQSWVFDFTGRQRTAEQIQRDAMRGVYGSGTYVTNAGQVTKGESVYEVTTGAAIIDGLRVEIPATDTAIDSDTAPENYPFYIYATVAQTITGNSVENTVAIETSQTTLDDYTGTHGEEFARVLIATLTDENTITDNREYITDALTLARPATTTTPGLVSLSNSTNSDSETEAATPKAVKSAKDAAAAAQATANTGVSNAATAQGAANNAQSTADGKLDGKTKTTVWTGSSQNIDLTTLPGGYPGDGIYLISGVPFFYKLGEQTNGLTNFSAGGNVVLTSNVVFYSDGKVSGHNIQLSLGAGTTSVTDRTFSKIEKII